jgi:transcriptional regulator with XRE-family HTH domain
MPLNMQTLGKRIVAAREQMGWSQRELVRVSGVGQNNLSVLEQGKKSGVRADTVVRLAEALGVSADYLLGLADDPTPPTTRPRPRKAAPVGEERTRRTSRMDDPGTAVAALPVSATP